MKNREIFPTSKRFLPVKCLGERRIYHGGPLLNWARYPPLVNRQMITMTNTKVGIATWSTNWQRNRATNARRVRAKRIEKVSILLLLKTYFIIIAFLIATDVQYFSF